MYTLIFNPGSLDTYTIGFELTVEELGGYRCNTQFLSIDSYDNNSIVNITLGDDISFSSNIISGSIKIAFISQYEEPFTESITMRYNDSNNNINKTISQQIKMEILQLVDLSYYAEKNIDNYQEITEIPQEHLEYLQSGLHASNMEGMFYGCKKLTTIPKLNIDTSKCISMKSMFSECQNMESIDGLTADDEDISDWDTSNVTDMSYMFNNCSNLFGLDLSKFDTNNVTDMSYMFNNCSSLYNLYFDNYSIGWNTSKVTDMSYMFNNCYSLSRIGVSTFDTSNVTNMSHMFNRCGIYGLDLSNFDTSKVTDMSYMFNYTNLGLTGVSNWNTSNVIDMSHMFSENYYLDSLDISNWDTSNVTDMSYMFNNSDFLSTIKGTIDMKSCTSYESMFEGCYQLSKVNIKNPPEGFEVTV